MKGKDIIIHLAAIVGFPACRMNPQLAKDVNVQGTINLINACDKNQIIFYGSTGSNYGAVTEICTEQTPLNPLSLYGETKTKAEQLLLDRDNTIAYRFATAFGVSPRLRLDLLVNDVGDDSMNFSKEAVCNMIGSRTNAFIHYEEIGEDADKRNYIVSYEKIKSLGFGTRITMEEGIDQIIKTLKVIDFENTYSNARYL